MSLTTAFDVSWLAYGHDPSNRTGIVRVVEALAAALAQSDGCRVKLTAVRSFEALDASLSYIEAQPALRHLSFMVPRGTAWRWSVFRHLRTDNQTLCDAERLIEHLRSHRYRRFVRELKLWRRFTRHLLAHAHLDQRYVDYDQISRVADVFHSAADPLPAAVRTRARFLTVYDVIPLLHPEFCVESQIRLARQTLGSVMPSDCIIVSSRATKDDICEITRIDPDRIFLTYFAADPQLFHPVTDIQHLAHVRAKYGIPDGPYLLTLGTLEPRKNLSHVVQCFLRLREDQIARDTSLVLVGSSGLKEANLPAFGAGPPAVSDRVVFTGRVADVDLAGLYSGALGFIFMSRAEGFGLPALEAMQCGTPVIASNTSAIPEVVGNAAMTTDPTDADGLCHAIWRLARDGELRAEMRRLGIARAGEFSWARCAAETVAAYRAALAT